MFTPLLFLLTDGMLRCNRLHVVLNEMVQVFPSGYCVAMGSAFVGKQLRFSVIVLLLFCCTVSILNRTHYLNWPVRVTSLQGVLKWHRELQKVIKHFRSIPILFFFVRLFFLFFKMLIFYYSATKSVQAVTEQYLLRYNLPSNEMCADMKLCVKLGETFTETFHFMQKIYGGEK